MPECTCIRESNAAGEPHERGCPKALQAASTADFVSSVRTEQRGIHDHVTLWVNGQNAGTLIVGLGQGAWLERLLLGTGPQDLGAASSRERGRGQ